MIWEAKIILLITFSACNSGELIHQNFYMLRNAADKTILQAETKVVLCKSPGIVGTTTQLSDQPNHRWQYSNWSGTLYLELDTSSDLYNNEVSMNSGEPFCYFALQALTLHQVEPGQDAYRVEKYGDDCLTGHGNGKRISWTSCDASNSAQEWEFVQS